MADFFQDACAASGLALVARTSIPTNDPDVRDAVEIARTTTPDALVTLGLWDLPHAVGLELRATGGRSPRARTRR